jgi:hypothetical protein
MIIDDKILENIVTAGIKVGTISTLKELGLLKEEVSVSQAERTYKKRYIREWREKGWITGYPTGNSQRGKYYYKRSELERASAMTSLGNAVPLNKLSYKMKI